MVHVLYVPPAVMCVEPSVSVAVMITGQARASVAVAPLCPELCLPISRHRRRHRGWAIQLPVCGPNELEPGWLTLGQVDDA